MQTADGLAALLSRREEFHDFVRRRLPRTSDADDVLQEALALATRNIATVRDEASLTAWFYRVLRNAVADHYRERERRLPLPATPVFAMPPHEAGGGCACAVALLSELPAAYREILTLVDVREEPLERAAEVFGLTPNNAAVRLHRARKALRERVFACCGCRSSKECLSCRCASGAA